MYLLKYNKSKKCYGIIVFLTTHLLKIRHSETQGTQYID